MSYRALHFRLRLFSHRSSLVLVVRGWLVVVGGSVFRFGAGRRSWCISYIMSAVVMMVVVVVVEMVVL